MFPLSASFLGLRTWSLAYALKDTLSIFTFSNIRYGRAPVGDLRWAPPLPPRREQTLQRGESERTCFQAQPDWQRVLYPWLTAYESDNFTDFYEKFPGPPALPPIPANLSQLFPPLLPSETEDCLFLDVHVPKEIFDRRGYKTMNGTGSAIMLWVHGGGLILGSKTTDSDFKGLLAKSRENSQEPVIIISINYRVSTMPCLSLNSTNRTAGGFWFLGRTSFTIGGWCLERRTSGSAACIPMGTEKCSSIWRRCATCHRGW